MTIQDIISKNQVHVFFKTDPNKLSIACQNEFILLKGRYDAVTREQRIGMITRENAGIELARINYALMDLFEGVSFNTNAPVAPPSSVQSTNSLEQDLSKIAYDNKRRRPEIAQEATRIKNKMREWQDMRSQNPAFDPTGRRWNAIKEEAAALMNKLKEQKADSLEQIVERIVALLSDPIPSYTSLEEAYNLAVGRGFRDSYVKENLHTKPNDREVKITIAERIEGFSRGILAK